MKYDSNTPMYSKDIAQIPFFVPTGRDVHTDKGEAICPRPILNGGGIINIIFNILLLFCS